MYSRLSNIQSPTVYFHYWPLYYELLWPLIDHPRTDINFVRVQSDDQEIIDNRLEGKWKKILLRHINKFDYDWHPARAYSKKICEIHPQIKKTLSELNIEPSNIILNCTDLDPGVKYVSFKVSTQHSEIITFQNSSIHNGGKLVLHLNIYDQIEFSKGVKYIDVSFLPSFSELVNSLANAKLHIGIDSGPAHVALALGKPVVLYYKDLKGHKSLQGITNIYKNYLDQIEIRKYPD
jgi:hypothetical protein